jgi:hypothetical protein
VLDLSDIVVTPRACKGRQLRCNTGRGRSGNGSPVTSRPQRLDTGPRAASLLERASRNVVFMYNWLPDQNTEMATTFHGTCIVVRAEKA